MNSGQVWTPQMLLTSSFQDNMSKLGMAFASSGGDAKLQMAVIEGLIEFVEAGERRVRNSVLSGPLTHAEPRR